MPDDPQKPESLDPDLQETLVPGSASSSKPDPKSTPVSEAETMVGGSVSSTPATEAETMVGGSGVAASDQANSNDATVVGETGATAPSAGRAKRATTPMPETIGSYRVLDVVGEGGMGCVYLAEQENPKRTVALKVIKPGVANEELLRRFETEAQVLGKLHHPGIAQIYEAGTADTGFGPQPFFAMEYVEGNSLLDYIEKHKLGTRKRLDLFRKICEAVQHAHQKGLIHRDLKPDNILVDQMGQPKILDFGVARATDSDVQTTTMMTDVGQLIGTVPYMSPEQVSADPDDLDTRSDVYALGVILYEMLAGQLPYNLERKMIHEAVRIIREQEPTSLSQVNRVFRGDVETIVRKALEKDKVRRYGSAVDLAEDIERYLTDQPIEARPPSAYYQASKFAKRHKALVGGAVAVLIALVAGLIFASYGWAAAAQAQKLEAEQRVAAEQAKEEAVEQRAAAFEAREQAVLERDRAVVAEQLADENRLQAEAAREEAVLAREEAVLERDRAVVAEQRAQEARAEAVQQAAIAQSVNEFLNSDLLAAVDPGKKGREVRVRDILDTASRAIEGQFEQQPLVEASIRSTLGRTYHTLGAFQDAEPHLMRSLHVYRATLGRDEDEALAANLYLGRLYHDQGRFDEAEAIYTDVIEARRAVGGDQDPVATRVESDLARLYDDQRQFGEAEPILLATLEHQTRTLGENNPQTMNTMHNLAKLYIDQERYAEAEPMLKRIHEVQRTVLNPEHPETLSTLATMADLHIATGRRDRAVPLYVQVLSARQRVLSPRHPQTIETMHALAKLYREQGRREESRAMSLEVVEIAESVLGPDHPSTLAYKDELAVQHGELGDHELALPLHESVVGVARRELPADDVLRGEYTSHYALCLRNLGRYGQAEPVLLESYQTLNSSVGPKDERTRRVVRALVGLYLTTGQQDQASRWRQTLADSK